MKDITTMEDIRFLVDTFYEHIRNHALLGPVFNGVIKDQWPGHLEKMYRFWQTVLLGEHTYYGRPFPPHAHLAVEQTHFSEWLVIWHETVNKHFAGEKAEEARWRGDKMAAIFLSKIEYYRNNSIRPLL